MIQTSSEVRLEIHISNDQHEHRDIKKGQGACDRGTERERETR